MKENWTKGYPFLEREDNKDNIVLLDLEEIDPNPFQPRRSFPEEKIQELMQSIKTYGLLHPVIVRRAGKRYQLVVGERRTLACKRLGWKTIPAVVKEVNDSAMATIALIENLQRENLNVIEEATGYARLLEEFNLTQEALAQRLGKNQSTIANKMRLLKLPEAIKKELIKGTITERHARALLKLGDRGTQMQLCREIVEKGLTVQQTERKIEMLVGGGSKKEGRKPGRIVVRDMRIFLNTIRQAIDIIEKSGLNPQYTEREEEDYLEVVIRLPKG